MILILSNTCSDEPEKPLASNPLDRNNPKTHGDPFNLVAIPTIEGITLIWNDVPLTGKKITYNVYRSTVSNLEPGAKPLVPNLAQTQYQDNTAKQGIEYYYWVSARDEEGRDSKKSEQVTGAIVGVFVNGKIINGKKYTNNRTVTLTIYGKKDSKICVSNIENCSDGPWEDYKERKTWFLPGEDGQKTVSVKFKDVEGIFKDSIILDTKGPALTSVIINNNARCTNLTKVDLELIAEDETSGVAQMLISNDEPIFDDEPKLYNRNETWDLTNEEGTKIVYVKYLDLVENESGIAKGEIILDTTKPTGKIIYDPSVTNKREVTLTLTAYDKTSEVVKMMISEDKDFEGASWEEYKDTKLWKLSPVDEQKYIYAKFKDCAGNVSDIIEKGITLDTHKPLSPIFTINDNHKYTSTGNVMLRFLKPNTDVMMIVSNFPDFVGANWEPFVTQKPWTLMSNLDGEKTVYAKFKDDAGNESSVGLDRIILDTHPPKGAFFITNNAEFTNSVVVDLAITASDKLSDTVEMRVSNDAAFPGNDWVPYQPNKKWRLLAGDESKTVYVQFKDEIGNISDFYSDSIILDTTSPTCTVEFKKDITNSRTVKLILSARDNISDAEILRINISNDNSFFHEAEWHTFQPEISWILPEPDGLKNVYIKCQDIAGNISQIASDTLTLDTSPPTGSIVINENANFTSDREVNLTLEATDVTTKVTQMMISNLFSFQDATWEEYRSSRLWELSLGYGPKTVYVKFRDTAGNESPPFSDNIELTSPEVSIKVNDDAVYTNTATVTLSLRADKMGAGVHEMMFSNNKNLTGSKWQPFNPSLQWELESNSDGKKTVYAKFRDIRSMESPVVFDEIILDTHSPYDTSLLTAGGDLYTNSQDVNLILSAQDSTSGLGKVIISNDGQFANKQEFLFDGQVEITVGWQLSEGDGTKEVYAIFFDKAGNPSKVASDDIILDQTSPSGSILINEGDEFTNLVKVSLELDISDNLSGVAEMTIANDTSFLEITWIPYKEQASWQLPFGDGDKIVYAKFKDAAGNVSSPLTDEITLDTTPPSAPSLIINGGSDYTTNPEVILALSAQDKLSGVAQMRVNSSDSFTGIQWEAYNTKKEDFQLVNGDGRYTIYAQFQDGAGNVSDTASDTIILDTKPPKGSFVINDNAAYTKAIEVTLTITATDDTAGIVKMMVSNDENFSDSAWELYAPTKRWVLPSGEDKKTVYLKFRDVAGNVSSVTDEITLDASPPSDPSLTINDGSEYAISPDVTLSFSAQDNLSGVAQMRVNSSDSFTGIQWQAYQLTFPWSLVGDDGGYTIYAQFQDSAGNESTIVFDTIILDTHPPKGNLIINDNSAYTKDTEVTLTLTATDETSEVDQMMLWNEAEISQQPNWKPYEPIIPWTLHDGEGTKTVNVKLKDRAGNSCDAISDSIILDKTPPTGTVQFKQDFTNSHIVILTLSAKDSFSGEDEIAMNISNNDSFYPKELRAFQSEISWILPGTDGTKKVYVQYQDAAGNISAEPFSSDMITLDTHPPNGKVLINEGAEFTNNSEVSLTLEATDITTPVTHVMISNDVSFQAAPWEDYPRSHQKKWSLEPGDGQRAVYVKFKDAAGNESAVVSDTIQVTNPDVSILINNGAKYTTETTVTLFLRADRLGAGVHEMMLSNNPDFTDAEWQPFETSFQWNLESDSDGEQIVYAQFRDVYDVISDVVSDEIILDREAPSGSISINENDRFTNTARVSLKLNATKDMSGVTQMAVANDTSLLEITWIPYKEQVSWQLPFGDGDKVVYARFKDAAGNVSSPLTDEITLDTTPPSSSSLIINGGSEYTTNSEVTLALSAQDNLSEVAQMRISSSDSFTGIPWQAYQLTFPLSLEDGDGRHTIYAQFQDGAGNVSETTSNTIVLDTKPPEGSVVINGGAEYTNSTEVTLTFDAPDDTSGIDKMMAANDIGFSGSKWEPYVSTKKWILLPGEGEKTVYVKFKDVAGNESFEEVYATIEMASPDVSISINNNMMYSNEYTVTLSLQADKLGSGVYEMIISNEPNFIGVQWEEFAESKQQWKLIPTPDGKKNVYAKFRDAYRAESPVVFDEIILDTQPPYDASVRIADGILYTNKIDVTLTLSAKDSTSGVAKAFVSNDEKSADEKEITLNGLTDITINHKLSEGDGKKTVYAYFVDNAENVSKVVSDDIVLDFQPPSPPPEYKGITINDDSLYTNSLIVTLKLGASGASEMNISEDNSSFPEYEWRTFQPEIPWVLSDGDGQKIVSVKFRDAAHNESDDYHDSITLDTSPPSGDLVIINGDNEFTNNSEVWLTLGATDATTQVTHMMISNDLSFQTATWEDYSQSRKWNLESGEGKRNVYVKFRDNAGNESTPYADSITLDTSPPRGSVSIKPDDEYIKSPEVTLSLQAFDRLSYAIRMKISEDPSLSETSWEPYAQEKELTLSSGDGLKTIYVKYKDEVGNESEAFSDETILDTNKPAGSVSINDGAEATDKVDVTLTIEGTDETSGIDKMMVSNNEFFSGVRWEVYSSEPKRWELTKGVGEKTVYVKLVDKAGNESDTFIDTIELIWP